MTTAFEADLKIMEDTVELARQRDMKFRDEHLPEEMRFAHIEGMYERARKTPQYEMDECKRGRWISWMQASVCASHAATMQEFKVMNKMIVGAAVEKWWKKQTHGERGPEGYRGSLRGQMDQAHASVEDKS